MDFTFILLGGLGLLMVYMAIRDIQTYTIENWIVGLVAVAAPLYWWSAGVDLWPDAAIRIGVAAIVFLLLLVMFNMGVMGGGDVKLATALALWFTWAGTLKFLVIMSLAGGALSILVAVNHKIRKKPEKAEVPYGVAIAIGVLWLLTQRFLNHFA
ncbi:A24 family peptidase [Sphingomicrobium sediminis]|uniref:Prepilin peptidase n=1 Tax=Sphingomicrobium sediminis TaxID=2950949 RepID=A0A9X2EFN4_9SPHN|nr:prepilin peptidase [Sphingomicrobium sediminis]MCM8557115.1 prepilin peptidase [Sphingomicrobium sediminis]